MDIKRESIFVSAVRAFCNAFAGMFGIIIGLIILGIVIGTLIKPQLDRDKTTLLIAADSEGNRDLLPTSSPVILRINVHGFIGGRDLNTQTVETQLLDSRTGTMKGDRVKAILLHINSPGGTVTDSYGIYAKLMEYKEIYKVPIYAYVDGMCASGGMMIASSADKIFSGPVGAIGSIGVILGPNFNFAELMEKYGVKQLTITKGKNKDVLNPYREWKPGEDQSIRNLTDYNYNLFVDLVTKARPRLDRDKLQNEYGADIYDPVKAKELGYIDEGNSSYRLTLKDLAEHVEFKEDEKYQVFELKVQHPVLSEFLEGRSPILSGKIKHELQLGPELPPELMNCPLYLHSPAHQIQ